MKSEDKTVAVVPPLDSCQQVENSADAAVRAVLSRLEEFDSVWELTNRICDRYLKPVAA